MFKLTVAMAFVVWFFYQLNGLTKERNKRLAKLQADTKASREKTAQLKERLEGVRALYSQQQEEEKRITVLMNSSLKEHERYLKGGA